jgi:GntR family transcriptional regulator
MAYSTVVLPFRVTFQPGLPLHEQVTFAAKRALISGRLKPGDPFPSVRALSKALKINPNTAHKIITQLIEERLLDVRAASGTTVAALPASTRAERSRLLGTEVEQLVVEAKKLGLALEDLQEAIADHWQKLAPAQSKEVQG